jgi:hypothetical protein
MMNIVTTIAIIVIIIIMTMTIAMTMIMMMIMIMIMIMMMMMMKLMWFYDRLNKNIKVIRTKTLLAEVKNILFEFKKAN